MDQVLKQMQERMKKMVVQQKEQESYHCNSCKDKGHIFIDSNGYEVAVKCKCQILKEAKNKMNNSGLGDLLEIRTFENYIVGDGEEYEYQRVIKETAIRYLNEFLKGNKYSFAIMGQSGVGKTHIMAAVARKLIDENINVKYYMADEIVQILQANKFDEINYSRRFGEIANVGVLFIDDLFKTSINNYYNKESINMDDLRELFKVINYRCNKKLPILLNSEVHYERFKELDQATVGRINEMCNYEYLTSIKPDINKNYRLNRKSS